MWKNISVEKCQAFLRSHAHPTGKEAVLSPPNPAITISREEGAGGLTVASHLSEYLEKNVPSHEPWTVFSQQLVSKVLEEHKLHKRVGDFMKEGHQGSLTDTMEEWLGLHPSTWTLVEKTNATILNLAKVGNVILVGRGSNIVTGKLPNVFHVRLVGSFEKRVEQAEKTFSMDRKSAIEYIKKKDKARARYVKDNFGEDISDPLFYHIVINTDRIKHNEAATLIGEEVIRRFRLDVSRVKKLEAGAL